MSATTRPVASGKRVMRDGRGVPLVQKVERPLLENAVNNHVSPGRVLAFCAEPGMYVEDVVSEALVQAERLGATAYRYDYAGCDAEGFCNRLVANVRKINASTLTTSWSVVAFEGVPDLDEVQVRRCVRAIGRMTDRGGCVLLSMHPEAYQLVESIPGVSVFRACDLLLSESSGTGALLNQEARAVSGSIPHLAYAIMTSVSTGEVMMRREYLDALGELVTESLRYGLVDEEVSLRLALLLLGRGTFSDLTCVMDDVDPAFLEDLQRDAPLFGVDVATSTFACVGIASDVVFDVCSRVLRPTAERRPKLCAHAARLLYEADRTRRATSVLRLCADPVSFGEIGSVWFTSIIDVGALDVVRNALAAAQRLMVGRPSQRVACDAALRLVDGSRSSVESCRAAIDAAEHAERPAGTHVALLASSRLIACGGLEDEHVWHVSPDDRLGMRLLAHANASRMLAGGRFGAAYRYLLDEGESAGGHTISGSLLAADLALSRVFVCDVESGAFKADASCPALVRCSATGSSIAQSIPRMAAIVLGGASLRLSSCTSAAERAGLSFPQTTCLLFDAVASARRGENVKAHVQLDHAIDLARRLGAEWLGGAALLVDWAVRVSLGEPVAPTEMATQVFSRPFLSDVRQVMIATVRDGEESRGTLSDLALDRNFLWLLVVLSCGFEDFSPRFMAHMPDRWAAAVDAVQAAWAEAYGLLTLGDEEDEASVAEPVEAEPADGSDAKRTRVRINLLGRITLSVDGIVVSSQLLDQRRLRAYLSYLGAAPTHRVSLYQLIESVWPECDFEMGNKRLYSTVSAFNRALRSMGYAKSVIERSRADASMSLNMEEVSVDVDEFEHAARAAVLNEGNDQLVLAWAEQAEALYGGDLYVSQLDAGQLVSMRKEELRRLYVDAMVAGSEAAARMGSLRVAIRLAERAVCEDDLREDALSCMVDALVAGGRASEARDRIKRYTLRCVDALHRQPSRRILDTAERIGRLFDEPGSVGGSGEAGAA